MCKLLSVLFAVALSFGLAGCSGEPTPLVERTIMVDGTKSLAQMIEGIEFTAFDRRARTDFKVEVGFAREATVVPLRFRNFNRSEKVIATMTKRNLRPANLDECLAYAKDLLQRQRQGELRDSFDFKFICLGQSAMMTAGDGLFNEYKNMLFPKVPVIKFSEKERELEMWLNDEGWAPSVFLAIKK